jgi:diguanylate cyclase (GGDEF)-like protein
MEERECTQLILLPMLYQEKVKGVFALFLASYQHLVPEELLFIQTLANQAALAVENATLFQEVQQRAQEFSTLFEIAQTLTSSLGTKAIVDRILAAAQTLIGAERGFVFQRVGDSQEMECIMASGPYSKQILGKLLQLGEGITGFVAQTGIGERIDDTTHDPRALHISDTPEEPESMIVVPLKRKDQVFGVMTLSRVGVRPFREDDFRLISIFSTFAAATMENTRLYDEAAQMAITDYLTGLYNYRYFFKRLEEELSYSRRHGQKLSIVVIDLDRFKQYNDTYGHQEGDHLLARVGDALRASIRLSDVAFRYGGDEFSIIFPDTERREAQVVIDRLSERFHSMLPQNSLVQVRPSFGVATFPTDATDGEAIFRLADQRMYAMKEGRR